MDGHFITFDIPTVLQGGGDVNDFDDLEFGFDDLIVPEDLLKFTNIGFAEIFGETPSHLKIDVYKFRYDGDGKTITSIHRYASRLGMLLEILRTQGDQEFVFC